LVIIRKTWKLPYKSITKSYVLEYGTASFDLHIDAIQTWKKVAIIDDVLATWGTAAASISLIEEVWWIIHSLNFLIELEFLEGKGKMSEYNVNSLVKY
jgi:adenine phosphoribosyltransferase